MGGVRLLRGKCGRLPRRRCRRSRSLAPISAESVPPSCIPALQAPAVGMLNFDWGEIARGPTCPSFPGDRPWRHAQKQRPRARDRAAGRQGKIPAATYSPTRKPSRRRRSLRRFREGSRGPWIRAALPTRALFGCSWGSAPVVVPGELVPLRGDAIRKSNASASLECNFVWSPQSRPGRRRKSLPNQDAAVFLAGARS
jgi:hypothetical protein